VERTPRANFWPETVPPFESAQFCVGAGGVWRCPCSRFAQQNAQDSRNTEMNTFSQPTEGLIGASEPMQQLRRDLARIGRYDTKVLITGESGVGKELVAETIHRLSLRASRPMAAVNCAGLSETLLESELFGHVKGAFTGAYRDKPGTLELADRGTIFLDEVGEMTLRMQGLLLRFMEVGELQKVGSDNAVKRVNVRVVAATNRDLRQRVKEGHFREDLFYRLNVLNVSVPPLRERTEDVPALLDYFFATFARHHGIRSPQIRPEALGALVAYDWPGNVRELRNVVERLVVSGHELIRAEDLPMEIPTAVRPRPVNRETPRPVVDNLMNDMLVGRSSFWNAVYPLFMNRDITREDLRELIRRGLESTRGSYKIVAERFNMDAEDYKRFMSFLRKHDCQVAFQPYRRLGAPPSDEFSDVASLAARNVVGFRDFTDARRRVVGED
jgi:transcriptional regulator with GAF, ATPase, and Fis domain